MIVTYLYLFNDNSNMQHIIVIYLLFITHNINVLTYNSLIIITMYLYVSSVTKCRYVAIMGKKGYKHLILAIKNKVYYYYL